MQGKKKLVITESVIKDRCLMMAIGSIDSNSANELLQELENALEKVYKKEVKTIVLNMSGVEFLSSQGIRVILQIYKRVTNADGTFYIENPSEIVQNVLGMVALTRMLVTDKETVE